MKFRKKPVVIEAEQYDGPASIPMLDNQVRALPPGVVWRMGDDGHMFPAVKTLEGVMRVTPGDWIITGVKGERYPCKPDIFAATYERAESTGGPPFDGKPCPMCPLAIRDMAAVVHNLLVRWDAYRSGSCFSEVATKLEDLRRARAATQPLMDAHFANRAHSHGCGG